MITSFITLIINANQDMEMQIKFEHYFPKLITEELV